MGRSEPNGRNSTSFSSAPRSAPAVGQAWIPPPRQAAAVVVDVGVRYGARMSASSFKVTFLPAGRTVEVPRGHSVLDGALGGGISLDHACGGVCACSTCHVIVREGFASLPPASEREEDMLDNAPFLQRTSRLACQVEVQCDLVVEIPAMNRNLVSEGHH
jgi:2Fe-2S ferredoxin